MPDARGRLEPGGRGLGARGFRAQSAFQARFAILHRRRAPPPARCRHWEHGGWGGPPEGVPRTGTARALDPGGTIDLESMLRTSVPSLGLRPRPIARRPRGASKSARAK
jgi:hypothetical protein